MHYTRTWHTGALSALCTMHHIHAQWCTSSPCTITFCTCTHCHCTLNIADGCLDPREGPPKGAPSKDLVRTRWKGREKSIDHRSNRHSIDQIAQSDALPKIRIVSRKTSKRALQDCESLLRCPQTSAFSNITFEIAKSKSKCSVFAE